MSILTGKHVLVVGEETDQISKVEAALITYGATITTTTCETANTDSIAAQSVDVILLNHLHDGSPCRLLLQTLQQATFSKNIPVFALVQEDQTHINDAYMLGATDYITQNEDVHQVIEKVKMSLGEGTIGAGNAVIDITPADTSDTHGIRVFAVEDDPLLRNLLAVKFEKSNLPFELAEDGFDIPEKVIAFKPQIVILDLMLPGKDGFEVLAELKASAAADVPVVVFSNKDNQTDREKAEKLGAVAFFVKAMTDLSELIKVIEEYSKK